MASAAGSMGGLRLKAEKPKDRKMAYEKPDSVKKEYESKAARESGYRRI